MQKSQVQELINKEAGFVCRSDASSGPALTGSGRPFSSIPDRAVKANASFHIPLAWPSFPAEISRMNLPSQALVLDAGNTRTKAGWFVAGHLQAVWAFETENWKPALEQWAQHPAHRPAVIAWMNVGHLPDLAAAGAGEYWSSPPRMFPVTPLTPMPVGNAYLTPTTLGPDRLAGIVAGLKKFPGEKILVLDAGSALTYDYADASGTYLGGAISPGIKMRYQALHTFTAKLPLIGHQQEIPDLLGQSTEGCIRSGVVQGYLAEAEGMIQAFIQRFGSDVRVLVTGGDGQLLEKGLKTITFADQNLILKGIFEILIFNPHI